MAPRRNERYIVVQDTDQVLGELFENKTANARLLVLAANNFDAAVKVLDSILENDGTRGPKSTAKLNLARREAIDLLAKIEREAGEKV